MSVEPAGRLAPDRCVGHRNRCLGSLDPAAAAPAPVLEAEAGCDHRHPYLVAQRLVDDGAEDDVRIGVGRRRDHLRGFVDLEQADVAPPGDVQQDAGRALDRGLEQWGRDRRASGLAGTALARCRADAHHRRARVAHDRADVGEVEVDEAGNRDQVGDALHALAEHVVGKLERVDDRGAPLDHLEQAVVLDHDQRVHAVTELGDPLFRLFRADAALEGERLRDHADGQRADLLAELGKRRRAARARATPLAGPRPRVAFAPMWIFRSASLISSAWASVFTAMNSTPVMPASIIRLTAFVPPPPTPTTLITARKFPVCSLTLKSARPEAVVERGVGRALPRRSG